MDVRYAAAAGGIALVDVALSGDNAVVIGAVASTLSGTKRTLAIVYGGLGAIVLRLLLTIVATELLRAPLLRFAGGAFLLVVTLRLLLPDGDAASAGRPPPRLLATALTIIAADVGMSLDNVLAVGALASGDIVLLVGGLALSMTVLFVGSSLVARVIDRFDWLLDLAALILAWTAASLMLDDHVLRAYVRLSPEEGLIVRAAAVVFVLAIALALRLSRRGSRRGRPGTARDQSRRAEESVLVPVEASTRRGREGAPEEG